MVAANSDARADGQGLSRWLVWVSLISAAFGLLSFFDHLVPDLIRLSLGMKAMLAAYRVFREWGYDLVRTPFRWIHIHIPQIPSGWKDGIVVFSLVVAALNFESMSRYGQNIVLSLARETIGSVRRIFGGPHSGRVSIFDDVSEPLRVVAAVAGTLGLGLVASAILVAIGASLPKAPIGIIPVWLVGGLEVCVLGAVLVVIAAILLRVSDRSREAGGRSVLQALVTLPLALLLVPILVFGEIVIGLWNGRRAVGIAVALVAIFVGSNLLLYDVIDPLITHPPAWLQAMINADPDALTNLPLEESN